VLTSTLLKSLLALNTLVHATTLVISFVLMRIDDTGLYMLGGQGIQQWVIPANEGMRCDTAPYLF
jgi:hypothetical protein